MTPTKADLERFDLMQQLGCAACSQYFRDSQADVHHLLSGGRRRGHQFTIPLCPWHHRGVPPDGFSIGVAEATFGPSLARSPRKFRSKFGSDEELLEYVNSRIAILREAT